MISLYRNQNYFQSMKWSKFMSGLSVMREKIADTYYNQQNFHVYAFNEYIQFSNAASVREYERLCVVLSLR